MSSPSPTPSPSRWRRRSSSGTTRVTVPRRTTTTPPASPSPGGDDGAVLGAGERHLVRRFSAGLTPALSAEVLAVGGAKAWFTRQLDAASVADPSGDQVDGWFAYLGRTPEQIYQRNWDGTEPTWMVMTDLSRRTVLRRLVGSRQLHEVMVDFWSNLLHVPLFGDAAYARADYDRVIRTYALDSFSSLLQNAIVHPAMGINLNNNVSTKDVPNENLGRELLELHTVGVDAGYTEAEVKDSARILTGYRVDTWPAYQAYYHQPWHATGHVSVLGFESDNASSDGRAVTAAYLDHLARHDATARRIARRLCVRFVRDDPSDSIVSAVAAAYQANGTKIRPTLRALVAHPDFAASVGMKLRSPQEDWQATVRALGLVPRRPTTQDSFANAMYYYYSALGAAPYERTTPDGYPETNAAWSSAGRMLSGMSSHRTFTASYYPTLDVTVPSLTAFVPAGSAPLQQLIDTAGLALLGQKPGTRASQAVATALGWSLDRVLATWEVESYWTRITIVSTLLDSPLHLYR